MKIKKFSPHKNNKRTMPPTRSKQAGAAKARTAAAPPPASAKDTTDMLTKPLVVAAVGVGTSKLILPPMGTFNLRGIIIPWDLALFGGLYIGSLVSEVLHKYAFSHLPSSEKTQEPVSLAVAAGGNALVTAGVLRIANENVFKVGPVKLALTGALAEMIGDQLYTRAVRPMLIQ